MDIWTLAVLRKDLIGVTYQPRGRKWENTSRRSWGLLSLGDVFHSRVWTQLDGTCSLHHGTHANI